MKSSIFKVLDNAKIRQVHNASLAVLKETGIKVALKKMRTLLKTLLSILKALADKQNKVLQDSFIVEPPHLLQIAKVCIFFTDLKTGSGFRDKLHILGIIHSKMRL